MSALKTLNMLDVCFPGNSMARSFESAHTELHSINRHDFDGLLAQVVNEPGNTKYTLRNLCHELSFASKDNHRLGGLRRQEIQEVLNRSYMPEILVNRVLKPELPSEENLSPVRLIRAGKNPSLVLLVLNDENAEPRNKNVINLSCAVLHAKSDMIHQILLRYELIL